MGMIYPIWINKDKKHIRIVDMSDEYLDRTIKYCERKMEEPGYGEYFGFDNERDYEELCDEKIARERIRIAANKIKEDGNDR